MSGRLLFSNVMPLGRCVARRDGQLQLTAKWALPLASTKSRAGLDRNRKERGGKPRRQRGTEPLALTDYTKIMHKHY